MKKLMIAAAIVCAAVMTQASSFAWSSTTMYGPEAANLTKTGSWGVGSATPGDLLYYQTSVSPQISWAASMLIETSLGTDTIDNITPIVGYGSISASGLESAVVANGTDTAPVTGKVTVTLVGTYTINDVEYTITSDPLVSSIKSFGEQTTLQFDSGAVSTWTVASAVPEPTSGLLLLLGVAGLALKRKRA